VFCFWRGIAGFRFFFGTVPPEITAHSTLPFQLLHFTLVLAQTKFFDGNHLQNVICKLEQAFTVETLLAILFERHLRKLRNRLCNYAPQRPSIVESEFVIDEKHPVSFEPKNWTTVAGASKTSKFRI
jgi:hypothetical protein